MIINKLTANPSKSKAMVVSPSLHDNDSAIRISLNSSLIEVTDCIKYLGVLIDSKLYFNFHIDMIRKKLSRAL